MKLIRAGAIIVHKGKVLLFRRKIKGENYFVFPGGKKKVNETLEQAAVREAREETSVNVKVEKLLYKFKKGDIENNFFLCSYLSGEPKLGEANEKEEASDINEYEPIWKNISDFQNLPFKPSEIKDLFIEDVNKGFKDKAREISGL